MKQINGLHDEEVKIMVIKILTELRRSMNEQSKNFNKEIENKIKYQIEVTEMKTIIIELRNTIEVFNRRLKRQKKRSLNLNTGQ